MTISALADHLRNLRGVKHKLDIRQAARLLPSHASIRNGDDCAAIPDHNGYLLLAIEGLLDEFVAAEPWFAGYCAVMVNLSDIYAMGGRPIAVVDAIWSAGSERAAKIWEGMNDASARYGVPIVGGHTNTRSQVDHLAAAVLGRAGPRLLTSFDAKPGDRLIAAIDLRGRWFEPYPYWNASTYADGEQLRADLEILPQLAEEGLCSAAKDVSMGGIVGTAAMLADCSNVGMKLNIEKIPRPKDVNLERWLSAFPSYGFVLSVSPLNATEVIDRFRLRDIAVACIGECDDSNIVKICDAQGHSAPFWNLSEQPFIGYGQFCGGEGGNG